jgi:hypothetical protein
MGGLPLLDHSGLDYSRTSFCIGYVAFSAKCRHLAEPEFHSYDKSRASFTPLRATITDSSLDRMGEIEGCALCGRLWHAYSDAAFECVRLNNEHRRAVQLGDTSSVADLARKCEAEEMHRSNALETIRAHLAEAHPDR